jgi:hypothetical protein
MSTSDDKPQFLRIPPELIASITSYLPNSAIKNLRLTCRTLRDGAILRLNRVFLSANPRNVEVLRAIADHETLRHKISEIIWDDAQLVDYIDNDDDNFDPLIGHPSPTLTPPGCPAWFARACSWNVDELKRRKGQDGDLPVHIARKQQVDAQLPLDIAWDHYQQLLIQQDEVRTSGADAEAFRYGLDRFSSLNRITITPAAHGYLFTALYETPMIRDFPYGFNYPIPRGWPTPLEIHHSTAQVPPWEHESDKDMWRGFRIVTRELANHTDGVKELVVDANQLNTGLNSHVLDRPNEDLDNLITVLRRPGFRRIDLAFLAGGQGSEIWSSFRAGLLQFVLGEATDLQHVSLRVQVDRDQFYDATIPGADDDHLTPLRTIFPIDKWQNLRHFGLSQFLVKQEDLLSLLASLPTTLRSAELSFLQFFRGGNYSDLVAKIRDTLEWRSRAPNERPKVKIGIRTHNGSSIRAVWMDGDVNEFIYGEGANPFGRSSMGRDGVIRDGRGLNQPGYGKGILRDPFEPAYERPNVDHLSLMRRGFVARDEWLMRTHENVQ